MVALDVFGTYVFFSLSSRLPAVLMAFSAFSLAGFLLYVAWAIWPDATVVISMFSGVAFSLQYFAYAIWIITTLVNRIIERVSSWSWPITDSGAGDTSNELSDLDVQTTSLAIVTEGEIEIEDLQSVVVVDEESTGYHI
jgi:hypothetical protein